MSEKDMFYEMLEDDSCREKEFFDKFMEICYGYPEHSVEPYYLLCWMLEEEMPMEPHYLEALMYVHSSHAVDDTFFDTLEAILKTGYCKKYIEEVHQSLNEYVDGGWITVYRGEFATPTMQTMDYSKSVSYTVDYETAVHFATRFKGILDLTKSMVYTMRVPIEDVVAHSYREDSVMCIPICHGGKMQMVKAENMLLECVRG